MQVNTNNFQGVRVVCDSVRFLAGLLKENGRVKGIIGKGR